MIAMLCRDVVETVLRSEAHSVSRQALAQTPPTFISQLRSILGLRANPYEAILLCSGSRGRLPGVGYRWTGEADLPCQYSERPSERACQVLVNLFIHFLTYVPYFGGEK
jgi:hypothetical protein